MNRLSIGPRTLNASALALAATLGLSGCFLIDDVAGGGIETGNPELVDGGGIETGNAGVVVGRVRDEDGRPVGASEVGLSEIVLTPSGVTAPKVFTVLTDSTGGYSFAGVPHGRYALYVPGRGETRMAALQTRIRHAGKESKLSDLITRDVVRIEGRVLPAQGMNLEEVVACIPGTHLCTTPGPDSVYSFAEAPQGAYELVFLAGPSVHYLAMDIQAARFGTIHLRDVALGDSVMGTRVPYGFYDALRMHRSLSVMPVEYPSGAEPAWYAGKDFGSVSYHLLNDGLVGEITALDFFDQWKFRRELTGTSVAAGADLAAPLAGFPVPIRLTSADFDFSAARPDGGDLVVSDGNGRLLPHEIERWDAAAGKAEIWVRLDTLAALRADRKLVLHWGRAEAVPVAGGAGVFRAEDGFIGVWHLADRSLDNRVLDSRGKYHGYASESLRPDWKDSVRVGEAIIAGGHRLGSSGAYVHVPQQGGLDVSGSFTVSIWGRSWHSVPDHDQVLASKMAPNKEEWRLRILHDGTLDLEFGAAGGWAQGCVNSWNKVLRPDLWHLYTATFENGKVSLFVDGKEMASRVKQGSIPTSVNRFGSELRIGSDGDLTKNWEGTLDDFSYYSTAKSPIWVDMLFRTQRPF